MRTNILNIKCVSVWWWLYALTNTEVTFEVQIIKVKQHWDLVKKKVAYKKSEFIFKLIY